MARSTALKPDKLKNFWLTKWAQLDTPWENGESLRAIKNSIGEVIPKELVKTRRGRMRAFVPLCGASLVVPTLLRYGFEVTGLDYVSKALQVLRSRLSKHKFKQVRSRGKEVFEAQNVTLIRQDIFTFKPMERFELIVDRAALIAIHPRKRAAYARTLTRSLAPGGFLTVVTYDYRGKELNGPPYRVTAKMVKELFPKLRVRKLQKAPFPTAAHLKKRGFAAMTRVVMVLQARSKRRAPRGA
jgi:hypothetical protein